MGFAWQFEIEDSLSEKALRMDASLSKLEATSRRMEKALGEVDKSTKHTAESMTHWVSKLDHAINLGREAASVFAEMGTAIYEVGKRFAETALEGASFHEATLVGMKASMGGDGAKADAFLNQVVHMASQMPITTGDALQTARQFLGSGFTTEQIGPLLTAASDVNAQNGGGEEGRWAQRMFTRQIDDMMATGLSSRHMQFLSQEAKLPEGKILDEIAKIQGWKGLDAEEEKKRLHEVNKLDGITAILRVVAEKSHGKLGDLSQDFGKTVEGLYTTLNSRKLELGMAMDKSKGFDAYKGFLENLVKATDTHSDFGKELQQTLTGTFDSIMESVFGDFAGPTGAAKLQTALSVMASGGGSFLKGVGQGMGGIFEDLFGKDGKLSKTELDQMKWKMQDLGQAIGSSFRAAAATMETLATSAGKAWTVLSKIYSLGTDKNDPHSADSLRHAIGEKVVSLRRSMGIGDRGIADGAGDGIDTRRPDTSGTPAWYAGKAPMHIAKVEVNVTSNSEDAKAHGYDVAAALMDALQVHSVAVGQ